MEKVRVVLHQSRTNEESELESQPGTDRLSEKAKSTLPQYDLLRNWQGKGGDAV